MVVLNVVVDALLEHEVCDKLVSNLIGRVVRVGKVPFELLLDIQISFIFYQHFVEFDFKYMLGYSRSNFCLLAFGSG